MSYSIVKKYSFPNLEVGDLKTVILYLAEVYDFDLSLLWISSDFKIGNVGTENRRLTIDDLTKIVTFDGNPGLTRFEFHRKGYQLDFSISMWQKDRLLGVSYHFLNKLEEKVITTVEEKLSLRTLSADEVEEIEDSKDKHDFWNLLHPSVVGIAKSRYESGHYADAVEAALKALNTSVKNIYKKKTGEELDGVPLMRKAFSPQNPVIVLDDIRSETGRSIQQGYMDLFAGAMSGIRNPKAHENIEIDENRAIHHLFISSLLFYKLEERL
jgi:uncharacterized protein (TIGR02391 family)